MTSLSLFSVNFNSVTEKRISHCVWILKSHTAVAKAGCRGQTDTSWEATRQCRLKPLSSTCKSVFAGWCNNWKHNVAQITKSKKENERITAKIEELFVWFFSPFMLSLSGKKEWMISRVRMFIGQGSMLLAWLMNSASGDLDKTGTLDLNKMFESKE